MKPRLIEQAQRQAKLESRVRDHKRRTRVVGVLVALISLAIAIFLGAQTALVATVVEGSKETTSGCRARAETCDSSELKWKGSDEVVKVDSVKSYGEPSSNPRSRSCSCRLSSHRASHRDSRPLRVARIRHGDACVARVAHARDGRCGSLLFPF